jgi:hypothetical protein
MSGGSLVPTTWRVLRLRMLGGPLVTTAWRVLRLRMLGGPLVTTAWRVLRLRIEETASREGSCEYTEEAVADSRQGVVLQLGEFNVGLTTHHNK